jgi:hypothetical protein
MARSGARKGLNANSTPKRAGKMENDYNPAQPCATAIAFGAASSFRYRRKFDEQRYYLKLLIYTKIP